MEILLQALVNGLLAGSVIAVPAVGFTAIFAILRYPSFAIAGFRTAHMWHTGSTRKMRLTSCWSCTLTIISAIVVHVSIMVMIAARSSESLGADAMASAPPLYARRIFSAA